MLGGDRQRRAARRQHAQVGRRRDEERHELGDRLDDVLAVVEHEQARRLGEPLRDPRAEVGALLGRQRAAGADRVADAEHRADLADDVLGRGDAGELDHVDDRLRGVAREDVGEARLAEPARPEIETTRALVSSARSRARSRVAAEQRRRVVADAAADRPVERQQVAMRPLQPLAGVGAEPVAQVLPVALVALERRAGAAHAASLRSRSASRDSSSGCSACAASSAGSASACAPVRLGARARITRADADIGRRRAADLGSGPSSPSPVAGGPPSASASASRARARRGGVAVQRGGGVADERGEPRRCRPRSGRRPSR